VARSSARTTIRLGTRGGALALWQAREVARLIAATHPQVASDIRIIRTTGDRERSAPIAEIGGTGVFTRDIEHALKAGAIDLAVHSLKDLPTRTADGLTLAAILERADPRDALAAPPGTRLAALPPGARIGTSSSRRRAQLLARRPDLVMIDLRGNVPTRLAKLDRGDYEAIVLACAGLQRLGLENRVAEVFEPDVVMPAPGQGALAVEARANDGWLLDAIKALDHLPTRLATTAERACLAGLDGGCLAPVGALGRWSGDVLTLAATVAAERGTPAMRERLEARVLTDADAEAAGRQLADLLLRQGAGDLIAALRQPARGSGPATTDTP
jgi:hydroxymethylbilane synthase